MAYTKGIFAMDEYVTNGVVLEKRETGEADAIVTLYTEEIGRVTAFARSSRKMTAKLAAHLEPGSFSIVRLIRKKRFHIVDALKERQFPYTEQLFSFLLENTFEHEHDPHLWQALLAVLKKSESGEEGIGTLLQALGYDPAFAVCAQCGVSPITYVRSGTMDFYCRPCGNRATAEYFMKNLVAVV